MKFYKTKLKNCIIRRLPTWLGMYTFCKASQSSQWQNCYTQDMATACRIGTKKVEKPISIHCARNRQNDSIKFLRKKLWEMKTCL